MASPQDLQAIVDSWSPNLNKSPSRTERMVLEIMHGYAKEVGDVGIPASELQARAARAAIPSEELNGLLFNLGTDQQSKNCVSFDDGRHKLRAAGWEVFESRQSVLKRLTLFLAQIHKTMGFKYIQTSFIARRFKFGDYTITNFYLKQLYHSGVVELKPQTLTGRNGSYVANTHSLTPLGEELAIYLQQSSGQKKPAQ